MSMVALPRRAVRVVRRAAGGISYRKPPTLANPISQPCTFDQVQSSEYLRWCERLGLARLVHRKTWEWIYILQVLQLHGMFEPGRRGLGFGVGHEPITAIAAKAGAYVLATDLPASADSASDWDATGEHAHDVSDLNLWGLCDPDDFAARVTFEPVDMRAVPNHLAGFDFTWSSCAMEHLGTHDAGLTFLERQLECLKPGGVGVHTTEYNVDPDGPTLGDAETVLYQRQHLEEFTQTMRKRGHSMRITFALGTHPEDVHVDERPYSDVHIRTETYGYIHTSFGLTIQRRR
jgi:hypothetical protein